MIVHFQNQRHLSREFRDRSLEKTQRRGIGIAAGLDRQPHVIGGIIAGRVWRETARRAVLETLINGQNDQLACPAQPPVIEDAREVGEYARILPAVSVKYFTYTSIHNVLAFASRQNGEEDAARLNECISSVQMS